MNSTGARSMFLCSVGSCFYAIPIEHVVETMRPLPIEPIPGAPEFVSGLAIVRGVPLPVVSASRLLRGAVTTRPGRFITLRAGDRRVVLAVDGVLGVRHLSSASTQELPPLLRDAAAEVVARLGALDAQLLFVLRTMQLVPESLMSSFAARAPS